LILNCHPEAGAFCPPKDSLHYLKRKAQFVICIGNKGYPASLELRRVAHPSILIPFQITQLRVPRPFDSAQGRLLRSLQWRVAMLPMRFLSKSRGVSAVPTGLGSKTCEPVTRP
jgi:hypothetical protein